MNKLINTDFLEETSQDSFADIEDITHDKDIFEYVDNVEYEVPQVQQIHSQEVSESKIQETEVKTQDLVVDHSEEDTKFQNLNEIRNKPPSGDLHVINQNEKY